MRKFKENPDKYILRQHNKIMKDLDINNIGISYLDNNGEAHGIFHGNPLSILLSAGSQFKFVMEKVNSEIPGAIPEEMIEVVNDVIIKPCLEIYNNSKKEAKN